ncbi:MAG: D-glycerate dehydrogenase [Deltaproteobacteria bacterium]|nr:D-glycerate dehydrogenase [Deltaproteobacteria bacterium]
MKIGYLTQARPEMLARIPGEIPHVVAYAGPDGVYAPDMLARLADVDAFMVAAEPVNAQLLAACPKVKIVQRMGVGYNTLDLPAIAQRGIPACNVAGVNKEAVAEHAMALILALAKQLPAADRLTRECRWPEARLLTQRSFELLGKTLGIIGLGATGTELARRAQAFGMRILYNDIRTIDPALVEELGAQFLEKDALIAQADILSIHTDLNPTSRGLLDAGRIERMKRGAFLVCCARGGIVDEQALCRALESGHLAGAGMDVYAVEPPPPGHPLLRAPNILCTSHTAGVNPETSARAFALALDNVRAVVERDEQPRWTLNAHSSSGE